MMKISELCQLIFKHTPDAEVTVCMKTKRGRIVRAIIKAEEGRPASGQDVKPDKHLLHEAAEVVAPPSPETSLAGADGLLGHSIDTDGDTTAKQESKLTREEREALRLIFENRRERKLTHDMMEKDLAEEFLIPSHRACKIINDAVSEGTLIRKRTPSGSEWLTDYQHTDWHDKPQRE